MLLEKKKQTIISSVLFTFADKTSGYYTPTVTGSSNCGKKPEGSGA